MISFFNNKGIIVERIDLEQRACWYISNMSIHNEYAFKQSDEENYSVTLDTVSICDNPFWYFWVMDITDTPGSPLFLGNFYLDTYISKDK